MRPATPLLLVLIILSPAGDGAPAFAQASALPEGNGARFRERMLAWTGQAPDPSRPKLRPTEAFPAISSPFGPRRDPLDGSARHHGGIDIPARHGTPVRASVEGVVRFSGEAGGYGNMVELDHGGGLVTRYAHLSRRLVRSGARVGRGETLGLVGSSGRATGSHLHFEVREAGRAVAPDGYFQLDAPPSQQAGALPHRSAFARQRDSIAAVAEAAP
ncbi:M23 family metallopeptidase [Sandaracinobacter sp. RS1-74]|uniref:M23 family metallopeptidase n=1 Tax=Sandaracinobacteroides sayramensis TaxID=2913411 RepID=UPI001EDBA8FE|nr:M23 family metallopeptidase [Sandaracinobacteroides sayramensis]MCG2840512.1 M23 family metallopeptidase [Sandaracinobacteroides sayramensis]